ncbi:MAG: CoA transferase [Anaerococcus sp.]
MSYLNQLNDDQRKIYEAVKEECGFVEPSGEHNEVLEKKAQQSLICYESLKEQLNLKEVNPIIFTADSKRFDQMIESCFTDLTVPEKFRPFFIKQRLQAVLRLFQDETVLQTPPLAAVLAACATEIMEISQLNNMEINKEEPIYCDVAYAGLQAVRLYFAATFDPNFTEKRSKSLISVNNALNGIFYKYKTQDDRFFSFHLYYESQKEKILKALNVNKAPEKFNMLSLDEDIELLNKLMLTYKGVDLEEYVFDNGGSASVIRNRDEWNSIPVGKAVNEMPLLNIQKTSDGPGLKNKNLGGPKGPLQGLKVLDLTHIIAGAACTRLLAENGADVLLVRRKEFSVQEQAFSELDGWAGKRAIDLDLNNTPDLEKIKELIKEADVLVYTYQNDAFDKFGLSREEILELNPNLIHASLMCFSETVWHNRPGWAPLAEDITGLSIRNGSQENPKNLNGVPLDYIPGLILALGTLEAIKRSIADGGTYTVVTSLTRGAVWLHECTDLCENNPYSTFSTEWTNESPNFKEWESVTHRVKDNAVGDVSFPAPGTAGEELTDILSNMKFTDGNKDFRE